MTDENKKKSLTRKLQDFMASYTGKVMLNYAYSWGAAVVILGALFKLTHLPGANFMLFAGMGTEVLVFFISAFDRPFKSYKWESVFPQIKISGADYNKKEGMDSETDDLEEASMDPMSTVLQTQGTTPSNGGGTIIIGGGLSAKAEGATAQGVETGAALPSGVTGMGSPIVAMSAGVNVTPGVEVSPEMEDATKAYLEQLKEMTDALGSFVAQTKSMGQDAEQITTLSKNLTGINAIYEIQLRNVSSQLGTLDQINDQTKKMAEQINELNKVYARMLEAMTVNMKMNGAANA